MAILSVSSKILNRSYVSVYSLLSQFCDCRSDFVGVMELVCAVQSYDWGKLGYNSKVANLAKGNNPAFELEESTPYAELWMGTHPNGPSKISKSKEELKSWIRKNPHSLGNSKATFGLELPFLFKVLSINKPLSIQAHPDKMLAKKLHSEKPDVYKDPNHKPEMAIALTPFEVLVGFRPYSEIKTFLEEVPELKMMVSRERAQKFINSSEDEEGARVLLAECFGHLMHHPQSHIDQATKALYARLSTADKTVQTSQLWPLVQKVRVHFPSDVGLFGVYFFNHMVLNPGEAVFLGANVPHAYLSGDCVECMACSDNVVRAGLTPKAKDVITLLAMLDYRPRQPSTILLHGLPINSSVTAFAPPVPDFSLVQIDLKEGSLTLDPRESASLFLVVSGEGTEDGGLSLLPGSVLFVPAGTPLHITASTPLLAFTASVNDNLLEPAMK